VLLRRKSLTQVRNVLGHGNHALRWARHGHGMGWRERIFLISASVGCTDLGVQRHGSRKGHLLVAVEASLEGFQVFLKTLVTLLQMANVLGGFGQDSCLVELVGWSETFEVLGVVVLLSLAVPAILSFKLVRYLFSIMLCAVFLGGWAFSFLPAGSDSESVADDFRFFGLSGRGSGLECADDEALCTELGLWLWWRLGVLEAGTGAAETLGCPNRGGENMEPSPADCCCHMGVG
jgi:hypothetical protein